MELPQEYVNVMITYKATICRGVYGEKRSIETVTRRAFYTKSEGFYDNKNNWVETPNGYFSVPQFWKDFTFSDGTVALLPYTFYSYGKVYPENIINWVYDKN